MRVLLHGPGFGQYHICLVVVILFICHKIHVQVDVQFAHLTVIIGIALPIVRIMGMTVLMRKVAACEIVFGIYPHIVIRI